MWRKYDISNIDCLEYQEYGWNFPVFPSFIYLQIFQTNMNYFSNGKKKKVKFLFQGNTNKISSYVISSCLDT